MSHFTYNNKKVYYKITGQGEPLLLLHGNTASSKMFASVIKSYAKTFQVILMDFPGHGKSERLDHFETDFWFYNAEVVFALIKHLQLNSVSVIGTSGGALVGINLALEHPGRIKFLVADSFEGAFPLASYINSLKTDREKDKKKLLAKLFWFYCHGFGWKKVVDADTEINLKFAAKKQSFFHKSISELTVPTLLTGSLKDEYCHHLDDIYKELKHKNKRIKVYLFETGGHPAMLSNKNAFLELVKARK